MTDSMQVKSAIVGIFFICIAGLPWFPRRARRSKIPDIPDRELDGLDITIRCENLATCGFVGEPAQQMVERLTGMSVKKNDAARSVPARLALIGLAKRLEQLSAVELKRVVSGRR